MTKQFESENGTPWGAAQEVRTLQPGVTLVTTASHGGIHLDDAQQKLIPEQYRQDDQWYEEDCEIAIPIHFLQGVLEECKDGAKRTFEYLASRGIQSKRMFILEKGQSGWPYPKLVANN